MGKHTPGPLFVVQPEKWPFDIQTVDANGNVVFSERRMAYGSNQKTIADVMDGHGFKDKREEAVEWNARQLADAYLRAAAPDLLQALQKIHANGYTNMADHDMVASAIAKATGETP
jgi:hypothetical protein